MSFQQLFDRVSRIIESSLDDLDLGSRYKQELRRAQELIREHELEEELKKKGINDANTSENSAGTNANEENSLFQAAVAMLGVPATATLAEIAVAYRKKIVLYHPDRQAGRSANEIREATRRASELNAAYSYLKDYHSRKA